MYLEDLLKQKYLEYLPNINWDFYNEKSLTDIDIMCHRRVYGLVIETIMKHTTNRYFKFREYLNEEKNNIYSKQFYSAVEVCKINNKFYNWYLYEVYNGNKNKEIYNAILEDYFDNNCQLDIVKDEIIEVDLDCNIYYEVMTIKIEDRYFNIFMEVSEYTTITDIIRVYPKEIKTTIYREEEDE